LSAQDFLAVRDRIKGNFVIIPKHTIKSDEPVFIDGVTFEELKARIDLPVYDLDLNGLIAMLSQ